MLFKGDQIVVQRIGQVIYIIEKSDGDDILYEFTDESFQVVQSIFNVIEKNKGANRSDILEIYSGDMETRAFLSEFIDSLVEEKILAEVD